MRQVQPLIVNTQALVAQNWCIVSNQGHDYIQVITRDDAGDCVLIFVDNIFTIHQTNAIFITIFLCKRNSLATATTCFVKLTNHSL